MKTYIERWVTVLCVVCVSTTVFAEQTPSRSANLPAIGGSCWVDAGNRYGISPHLLIAIAKVESDLQPDAYRLESDGTDSIGLMQVHSWWHPMLQNDFGISRDDLWDPCTNIMVGAWILSQEIQRYGNSWTAVGAYNAGAFSDLTKAEKIPLYERYAKKVCKKLYPDHCK